MAPTMNIFRSGVVVLWLAGACTGMCKDGLQTQTLVAPHKNFPPLTLLTPVELDITADDAGGDSVVYHVAVRGTGKHDTGARMTICEGQFPQPLSRYIVNQDFYQITTRFASEYSCWYMWITKEGDGEKLHAVAYLYNTVAKKYKGEKELAHFILHVEISGVGPDFKVLQNAAETLRSKAKSD